METTKPQAYLVPTAQEVSALRRQYVMQKIIEGQTLNREIADLWNRDHPAFPVQASTIQADRKLALDELAVQTTATTKEIRSVLSARLDTVARQLQPLVEQRHLGAIDRYLKVINQQALLYGANMPAKIAFTDVEGTKDVSMLTDEERMARMAEILEQARNRAMNGEQADIIDLN